MARDPQALITSRVPKLRERAKEFQLAANHVFHEIRLGRHLRECVIDAMFSMGVMKVGLRPAGQGDEESWLHDSGKPFAEPVGLDDWVHDMTCAHKSSYNPNGPWASYPTLEDGIYGNVALYKRHYEGKGYQYFMDYWVMGGQGSYTTSIKSCF